MIGEPSFPPKNVRTSPTPGRISGVRVFPSKRSSAGFGSKVSIWLMPPWVTMRISDFAFAGILDWRGPGVISGETADARVGINAAEAEVARNRRREIEASMVL